MSSQLGRCARQAAGEHLLLLNNDVELIDDGFVAELLGYTKHADVLYVGKDVAAGTFNFKIVEPRP